LSHLGQGGRDIAFQVGSRARIIRIEAIAEDRLRGA
jgi:hypothetical protein